MFSPTSWSALMSFLLFIPSSAKMTWLPIHVERSPARPRKTIKKKTPKAVKPDRHADAIEALAHLGLTGITGQEIDDALKQLSLTGSESNDGKVIGRLFRFFKARDRQNSDDNVG